MIHDKLEIICGLLILSLTVIDRQLSFTTIFLILFSIYLIFLGLGIWKPRSVILNTAMGFVLLIVGLIWGLVQKLSGLDEFIIAIAIGWTISGILDYFVNRNVLKMKNKVVIESLLAAFLIAAFISFTGCLDDIIQVPFTYAVHEGIINPIVYLIVLDTLSVFAIVGSIRVITGWTEGEGKLIAGESTKSHLIAITVTSGFNVLGLAHSIILKAPLDESLLKSTFSGLITVALISGILLLGTASGRAST